MLEKKKADLNHDCNNVEELQNIKLNIEEIEKTIILKQSLKDQFKKAKKQYIIKQKAKVQELNKVFANTMKELTSKDSSGS